MHALSVHTDYLPQSNKDENINAFNQKLLETVEFLPPTIVTSSETGEGKTAMLHFIASLRIAFQSTGKLRKK